MQFQRVAVAERDTGSRFEIFRLRPSLRIDRCPVTCLKVEIRAVRLEPGGLILGDESLRRGFATELGSAPGGLAGGAGSFYCDDHQSILHNDWGGWFFPLPGLS